MERKSIILLMIIFCFSCSYEKADLVLQANNNVTPKFLKDQGFKRLYGVDVILFEKTKGDTSVFYQFESHEGLPYAAFWNLPVPSFDSIYVADLLTQYDCIMTSEFSCGNRFLIHSFQNNTLMRGRKKIRDQEKSIEVLYFFPMDTPAGSDD